MDRKGFVMELWDLYHRATNEGAYKDALMLLEKICEHEPKEKDK